MIDTAAAAACSRMPKGRAHKWSSIRAQMMANKKGATQLLIVMSLLLLALWMHNEAGPNLLPRVKAVSVQRLNVPDLVVIDQFNQQQQQQLLARTSPDSPHRTQNINLTSINQPEAASLINAQELGANEQQSPITFECLISYDKRKDKNLIVKWHHDDRIEPIYQWIPELNKRTIAPQYRAYIAPIVSANQHSGTADEHLALNPGSILNNQTDTSNSNQTQLLEAGFRLVRPSKELGAPPRVFRFNASRTDVGAQLASQRERLIQQTQLVSSLSSSTAHQLPLAYRMKGFESQHLGIATTISPQMYSTIDYINVSQQRTRQSLPSSSWVVGPPTSSPYSDPTRLAPNLQVHPTIRQQQNRQQQHQNGVKLICDIDQVFPVPEVSIYRLAKLDGSHPDKLAKLDTKIERNSVTGLYHVQVISILEDDELQMKYGLNEPVYFECLIALTNLELSKYADNKRSIVYRPGLAIKLQGAHTSEDVTFDQTGNSSNSIAPSHSQQLLVGFLMLLSWLACLLHRPIKPPTDSTHLVKVSC